MREVAPGETEEREGYAPEAVAARHRGPALAWALRERPLAGHLDRERLASSGCRRGPSAPAWPVGPSAAPGGLRLSPVEVTGPPRRGRLIVFSGDTMPSDAVAAVARGADLLMHEATLLERDRGLAASAGHSTAAGAAALARSAGVRLLALTHCSARYRGEEVEAEARAVFARTVVPSDFDLIEVPLPERGRLACGRAWGAHRPRHPPRAHEHRPAGKKRNRNSTERHRDGDRRA